jgi:hypothetical protein
VQTGAPIGGARVSASVPIFQRLERTHLAEAGCLRVFAGKLSGRSDLAVAFTETSASLRSPGPVKPLSALGLACAGMVDMGTLCDACT